MRLTLLLVAQLHKLHNPRYGYGAFGDFRRLALIDAFDFCACAA